MADNNTYNREPSEQEQGPQTPLVVNNNVKKMLDAEKEFQNAKIRNSTNLFDNSNPAFTKPKTPYDQNVMFSQESKKQLDNSFKKSQDGGAGDNVYSITNESFRGTFASQMVPPKNDMMKAIFDHKKAEEERIKIQARIIKLKKDEERAAKRIKDNMSQVEFREKMHKVKIDKILTKQHHYSVLREIEDKNRYQFANQRQQQKFVKQRAHQDIF